MSPINPNCYSKGARFNARKSQTDNYETPAWAVEALVNALKDKMNIDLLEYGILDPCCGRGVIVEELARLGVSEVKGTELRNKIQPLKSEYNVPLEYGKDLFDIRSSITTDFGAAVLNPPFTLADSMVLHLINEARFPIVCVLQRTQYMEGKQRYNALFKDHPETAVFHFINRVSMEIEGRARTVQSGMMTFSWFVWTDKSLGFLDSETRLFRIEDEPYFENDRRLVYASGKQVLEVRDLLDLDPKKMYFKVDCPSCKNTFLWSRKKGVKQSVTCPKCKGLAVSLESVGSSKFNTSCRIA
jgi:hypothetical protein